MQQEAEKGVRSDALETGDEIEEYIINCTFDITQSESDSSYEGMDRQDNYKDDRRGSVPRTAFVLT